MSRKPNPVDPAAPAKTTSVVSATVPASVRAALEDIRWGERLTMSEIVAAAVNEYLTTRGVTVEK